VSLLGVMASRGDAWMIRSWLRRHSPLFRMLAVLDGSPQGSEEAAYMAEVCASYPNVKYGHEADFLSPADRARKDTLVDAEARHGATKLLLNAFGLTNFDCLDGEWIVVAHPDEWHVKTCASWSATFSARIPR